MIGLLDVQYKHFMGKRVCIWVVDDRTENVCTYKCKRSDNPELAKKQHTAWQKYVNWIQKDHRNINHQIHVEKPNYAWMVETKKLTQRAMEGERSIPLPDSRIKWNLGSLFQISNKVYVTI